MTGDKYDEQAATLVPRCVCSTFGTFTNQRAAVAAALRSAAEEARAEAFEEAAKIADEKFAHHYDHDRAKFGAKEVAKDIRAAKGAKT